MAQFLTLLIAGLAVGSLYALVGLGLILIYKTQDVVNFAHGENLTLGAFVGYFLFVSLHLPYVLAFMAAILVGGVLGAVIERIAIRPIADHPHMTLAMLTVGLSFALRGSIRIPFGADVYTIPGIFGDSAINIGPAVVSSQSLVTIGAALGLCALLALLFRLSTIGKQMRATQQDIEGAKLVGVNTGRVFSTAWALGSAIGASAGILAGPISLLYTDMGPAFLLKGFAAAVLGGFDSLPGAIIGGFLVGVIELLCGGYFSTSFQDISAFCIMILVLLVKPNGLFGRANTRRV